MPEGNQNNTAHKANRDAPKGGTHSVNVMIITIVAIAAIIIVIAAYASYNLGVQAGLKTSKANFSTTGSGYTPPPAQNQSTPVVPQTQTASPTKINASDYSGFINVSDANTLIGPSNYSAYASTNSLQVNTTLTGLLPNRIGYNVTAEYIIAYTTTVDINVSGYREPTAGIQEFLLESDNAHNAYIEGLKIYSSVFNVTHMQQNKNLSGISVGMNRTESNMTYSYSTYNVFDSVSNRTSNYVMLLGYKGNTTVFVSMAYVNATKRANATQLASIVAGHISG